MRSHPFALGMGKGAWLVPDRARNPDRADIVHERGPPQHNHVSSAEAEMSGRPLGETSNPARVAECVRRLQVDVVSERGEDAIQLMASERGHQRGFCCDHRVPARFIFETLEDRRRILAEQCHEDWIESRSRAFLGGFDGHLHSARSVEGLEVIGQLHRPDRRQELVALDFARGTFVVPSLERLTQGISNIVAELELRREVSGRLAMGIHRGLDRRATREHDLGDDADSAGDGTTGTRVCDQITKHREPDKVDLVAGRPRRDVITEYRRKLMRVRDAADPREQRDVVGGGTILGREPCSVTQRKCQASLSEHVLHWLTQSEIDRQRQCRHQFSEPDVSSVDFGHVQNLERGSGHTAERRMPVGDDPGPAPGALRR